jgi:hypothetical protein
MTAPETAREGRLGDAFQRYLAAVVLSGLGDWFTYVALAALAASGPMQTLSLGAVALAHTLPRAAAAPIAGRLADHVDRRALLASAELFRGVAVVGMAIAAARGQIVLVHACHVIRGGLGAVSDTAGRAALPSWVAPGLIGRANRRLGVAWSATFAGGVLAGGAVASRQGAVVAFAIDAASFFIAVPLVLSLPAAPPRRAERARPSLSLLHVLRAAPALRRAALVRVPLGFLHGAAFVVSALRVGAAPLAALDIGLLHGARALGNVAGAEIALLPFFRAAATPIGAVGAVLAMVGWGGSWVAISGAALWGLGMGANWTFGTTSMQLAADQESLGRVVATDAFAFTLAWAAGACAAMTLFGVLPVPALALSLGASAIIAWTWLSLPGRARA